MRGWIGLLLALVVAGAGPARAEEAARYFRIATAGEAGTYFPVGRALAEATSTPGIVVSAVTSNGSIANVDAITSGTVESGLVQADVGHWAVTGTGPFEGKGPQTGLRAIAALYPETVHLVVRKGAGIARLEDLKGKHVSVDEPGSGTLADVRLILAAHRLSERDFVAEYYKPDLAAQLTGDGLLDGFFFVGGYPAPAIAALAARKPGEIALVALDGPGSLAGDNPFFTRARIPVNAYAGVDAVETMAVRTLWLTDASQPDAVVEAITAALWSEAARAVLDAGHAQARAIRLDTALEGLTVPLHPGAEAFYRKAGVLK